MTTGEHTPHWGSIDPRGPVRKIVEVGADRPSSAGCGSCTPLTLDCGHISECNQIFHYRVGDNSRCFACGQIAIQKARGGQ